MSDEMTRRDRIVRLRELATEQEERARAQFVQADHQVSQADRRRTEALLGAAELADHDLPLGLRGHLTGVGARHLVELADRRAELAGEADRRRAELAEAVTRVRSYERLVTRLDRAADERRRQREAADLQDLVAVRAALESR